MKQFQLQQSAETYGFKNNSATEAVKETKVPRVDSGGLFKDYELHKVNANCCETEYMDAVSLTY